jgi:hypothetical protein
MESPVRIGLSTSLVIAAIGSTGAGLVHAAAAGTHGDDAQLAWMFAACAAAQIGWAALAVAWPRRSVLALGIALNGGCVAVFALVTTVGLFGPLADVEAVGTQNLIAAILGAVAAGGAALALLGRVRPAAERHPATGSGAPRLDVPVLVVAASLVVVLAVPAMAATHGHDGEAAHEHGAVETAAGVAPGDRDATHSDHEHDAAAGGETTDSAADGPVTSLDDARLTSAQRARATDLLTRTRAALLAYPDEAALVAAGYTWIGDGRRAGTFQHFVNAEYMGDGRMLDPGHIESIVMQQQPDGTKTVMSAMYIAEPGTTMETVPDIGGELTVWHDHQNLCWNGNKLAGVLVNGVCTPGGTFRATAPMIHVWVDEPRCGPFTGIEGHGGTNCEHTHTPA